MRETANWMGFFLLLLLLFLLLFFRVAVVRESLTVHCQLRTYITGIEARAHSILMGTRLLSQQGTVVILNSLLHTHSPYLSSPISSSPVRGDSTSTIECDQLEADCSQQSES